MSRSAKKIKLEPGSRSNGHRSEDRQSLHSGQFMTSRIDDEVNLSLFQIFIF
jgi:hypothetical protein